jgi:hypothetical protein
MYVRSVLVTLSHKKLDPVFLAHHLNIEPWRTDIFVKLMALDEITPSDTDPMVPISVMDIDALKAAFEQYE